MTITCPEKDKTAILDEFVGLFHDEANKSIEFTKTQRDIIDNIVLMPHPRVGVIAPTQYGKSTSAACGIIIKGVLTPRKQVIIGGTRAKAEIIMRQVNQHVFDNVVFSSQLAIDGGAIERLRRERRRDNLTFKRGGQIVILSAENRNRKRIGEALLGFGGQDIYIDDSVLMDDDQYAYIKRMLGGHKDSFLMEFANPLKRNHFHKTMTDKSTHKIWIDYRTALEEGRFTPEFIAEMRKEMFFSVFYECKFPAEGAVDEKGYQLLLTEDEIDGAVGPAELIKSRENIIGVDVGRGGNRTSLCVRNGNMAAIWRAEKTPSLMTVAGLCIEAMQEWDVKPNNIALDDAGMGGGPTDRLKEQNYHITPVILGGSADKRPNSKIQYKNIRAQCYWRLREWIKGEGEFDGNPGMIADNDNLKAQLRLIKYRIDSSGNIQIQPKEDMQLVSGESPDEADSLACTFAPLRPEAAYSHDKRQNKTSYKNGAW
jgi:hypothetical protein